MEKVRYNDLWRVMTGKAFKMGVGDIDSGRNFALNYYKLRIS